MNILIIAGEVSGEIYGARLMREMRGMAPKIRFIGIGGDRMRDAGLELLYHCRDMASIGIMDMLGKARFYMDVIKSLKRKIEAKEFDAIILIDYAGLNFRIAKAGYENGVPVFYYVLPQVWAWRRYRIRALKKWVDSLFAVLPFEEKFYASHGMKAHFVGHPILDEVDIRTDIGTLRKEFLPAGKTTLVGLFPGSREGEVRDMLAPLVETADLIHKAHRETGFVIPAAPHISTDFMKSVVGGRDYITIVAGRSQEVMAASDLVITKSGTSTLEAAIFGTPAVLVYRSSHLSFWLAKALVKVKYAGLPNIIGGRELCKEFLQNEFIPVNLARHVIAMLDEPAGLEKARREMEEVRAKIGEKGAALRAASLIIDRLRKIDPGIMGGVSEPGYF